MGLLNILKKLVDPVGPIGAVLSPADVYKERLGLPIASPHTAHANIQAPGDIERALAPPRFVALADATNVPKNRIRQVSAFVEEHWHPVYASTDSTDMFEILRTSQTQIGWRVTQQQTASSRARVTNEQFMEVAQTLQIQTKEDEIYNGYYPTIPGNDPVVLDGEILRGQATYDVNGKIIHDGILRGGTQINGGRREYREKTKNFVHWDAGFAKQREAAQAEMDSRPIRNVRANLERVAGECLPMRRLLSNPRYDRKSGS